MDSKLIARTKPKISHSTQKQVILPLLDIRFVDTVVVGRTWTGSYPRLDINWYSSTMSLGASSNMLYGSVAHSLIMLSSHL